MSLKNLINETKNLIWTKEDWKRELGEPKETEKEMKFIKFNDLIITIDKSDEGTTEVIVYDKFRDTKLRITYAYDVLVGEGDSDAEFETVYEN